MEARAHPRVNLRLKTELVCIATRACYQRYVRNISLGGLFIAGSPCGDTGSEVSLVVTPINRPLEQSQRFSANIVRTANSGFALKFGNLSSSDRGALSDLMTPTWDGRNVFDGLLIVAAREHVMSLSECLRLTSVVCNRYRRICSAGRCRPDRQH